MEVNFKDTVSSMTYLNIIVTYDNLPPMVVHDLNILHFFINMLVKQICRKNEKTANINLENHYISSEECFTKVIYNKRKNNI